MRFKVCALAPKLLLIRTVAFDQIFCFHLCGLDVVIFLKAGCDLFKQNLVFASIFGI